jgi:hypothetical protein
LLPGIRKLKTTEQKKNHKTVKEAIEDDLDDLIMEDSDEDSDSLASSNGSSDIDWSDL